MKRSRLNPGKKHALCKGKGCDICNHRGWMMPEPKTKRPISKKPKPKRRELNDEYTRIRKVFMAENPFCQVLGPNNRPCGCPATECHHRYGRGRFHTNRDTFLSTCQACHSALHTTKRGWARIMGYIVNPASVEAVKPPSDTFLPYAPET